MNKFIGMGRLTGEPTIIMSNSGSSIAKFTTALDRAFKQEGQPTADFVNCVAFGKAAEFAEKYLHQGTKIIIEGRWQTGNYTNKDGRKIYTNDCVVERHEFCESKNNKPSNDNPPPTPMDNDGFMNIPSGIDEELPFN